MDSLSVLWKEGGGCSKQGMSYSIATNGHNKIQTTRTPGGLVFSSVIDGGTAANSLNKIQKTKFKMEFLSMFWKGEATGE